MFICVDQSVLMQYVATENAFDIFYGMRNAIGFIGGDGMSV